MNAFDMSPRDFQLYLDERGYTGDQRDDLLRRYRRANSPFAGIFDFIEGLRGGDEEAGLRRGEIAPMVFPEGMSGFEAFTTGQARPAVPGFLLGGAEAAASAVDAPSAAAAGLIPAQDAAMEALGTAGFAMGAGGSASMGRGIFDYDPTVARAIYGGSVEDALSLARSGDAIFHSGNASIADDIHKYGVEPTNTGPWVSEVAAGAVDDVEAFLSQNPSAAWWAEAPDWVRATAARAAGKHASDLTEDDIRNFGHLSIARGSDWGDEVFRIPDEGLDNGEYSYVTDLLGNRQRLYETPLYEHGDDGVGRYPFGIERNELVTAATIDPEFTLTGGELVDFLNRYNTTAANADKSTGLLAAAAAVDDAVALPAPRNKAEAMAKQVLEMRAAGRAGDVTEEMMAAADPQYMFAHTPLPMDEASRMARARELGFDLDGLLTHGSKRDIYGFSLDAPKSTDFGWYGQGLSLEPNDPRISDAYAMVDKEGVGKWAGRTYPVTSKGRTYEWPASNPPAMTLEQSKEITQSLRDLGYKRANIYAPDDPDVWGPAAGSWREQVVYDPTNIRSRFARFDPEFAHLRNLSAANADKSTGLLAAAAADRQFDVTRKDASSIFGQGAERVRYTDPQSGGTMEVVVRPDGSASVLELEVPEASRGQGIGQSLQERVLRDYPVMGGQVSSKAAATTAYRLGRRPYGQPDATLKDVFRMIDENSSVNLVSPQAQPAPRTPGLLTQ